MKIGPWGRRGLVVRASACGAGGPRFKSRARQKHFFKIKTKKNCEFSSQMVGFFYIPKRVGDQVAWQLFQAKWLAFLHPKE